MPVINTQGSLVNDIYSSQVSSFIQSVDDCRSVISNGLISHIDIGTGKNLVVFELRSFDDDTYPVYYSYPRTQETEDRTTSHKINFISTVGYNQNLITLEFTLSPSDYRNRQRIVGLNPPETAGGYYIHAIYSF